MLTSPDVALQLPDARPAYRPYRAVVTGIRRLSPHFTRVTFSGEHFATFGTAGLDQRINLIFPLEGVGLSDIGVDDPQPLADGYWYGRWRGLPDDERNPLRVYTVRAFRPRSRNSPAATRRSTTRSATRISTRSTRTSS